MSVTPAKKGCAVVLIIVGLLMAVICLGTKGAAGGAVVGAIILGIGILAATAAKEQYHVSIASSSAESHALTSNDRAYIEKIVGAVNEAIIRYR